MAYPRLALRLLCALGLSGALAACTASPTTLLLELEGDASITGLDVSVGLSTGSKLQRSFGLSGKPLPGQILVELPDVAVVATIDVIGTGGSMAFAAHAQVTSKPHRQVRVPLQLGASASSDLLPSGDGGGVDAGADGAINGDGPPSLDLQSPVDLPDPDLAVASDLSGAIDQAAGPSDLSATDGPKGSPLDLPATPSLVVLAGQYGGEGWHDDVGTDIRFGSIGGAAQVGNLIYVVEHWTGFLRTIDVTTRQSATVQLVNAGNLQPTSLDTPGGLAYDGAGYLYTASWERHAIYKIEIATGKVSRLIGLIDNSGSDDGDAATARFFNPWGVTFDDSKVLWVADTGNKKLRKIDLAGPTVSTPALVMAGATDLGGPATFSEPHGMALDAGLLYLADGGGVLRIDPINSTVTRLVANTKLDTAAHVAILGGNLYALDRGLNCIWRFPLASLNSGTIVAGGNVYPELSIDGIGSAARFQAPVWMLPGPTNDLWVFEEFAIRRVTLDTFTVSTWAGLGDHSGSKNSPNPTLRGPVSLLYDGDDTIYFSDYESARVRKYTISTNAVVTIAGNGNPDHVDGPALSASFYGPSGLALDGAGNLYIAENLLHTIRKLDTSGMVTTIAGKAGMPGAPGSDGTLGLSASFDGPAGLAFDGVGTLFVAEVGNSLIRSIDLTTSGYPTSVLVGTGSRDHQDNTMGKLAHFDAPFGLAYDAKNELLYITEINADTVRRADLSSVNRPVTTVSGLTYQPFYYGVEPGDGGSLAGTHHRSPAGIVVDSTGKRLYVANRDGDTIQRLDLQLDTSATIVGVPMAGFVKPGPLPANTHTPYGLALTPLGLVSTSVENVLLLATGIAP